MDLNRSVRLLEDALSSPGKSLLRTTTPKKYRDPRKSFDTISNLDLSLTVMPDELRKVLEGGISVIDATLDNALGNSTITGSALINKKPWETAIDALFMEYLEVIQSRSNFSEIFESVSNLARCCTDTLKVVKGLKSKIRHSAPVLNEKWLVHERNTWRLIFCLYQDRLNSQSQESEAILPYLGVSEKLCIENLYKRESLIRESQLIIDWLECNELEEENDEAKVQYYTDKTIGWENTLHQLHSSETIVFKSSRPIVKSMDPDAQHRENLPLHDLDMEDEERLCKKIFREIRCGRLEEAQAICMHCGHPWRAALLEGWRLFHNPNLPNCSENDYENMDDGEMTVEKIQKQIEMQTGNDNRLKPTEGNFSRDIWKCTAWQYCQQKSINAYDKASIATFCGCLQSILPVCTTWEDQLWAYMKTIVDIRVESEIRDFIPKEYLPLPEDYWNNKMSLDEVFEKISKTSDPKIKEEGLLPHHLIQKYLILDQIPQLMTTMETWLNSGNATPHFIRFLAHLVLFLKQIGHCQRDDIADQVLESYVKCLMERNEPELVAYYTATLNQHQQVQLYAVFLENITDNEERKVALKFGEDAGLNVIAITKQVVENIRNKPEDLNEFTGELQKVITEQDQIRISGLDWVLFYPIQRAEALVQCNALVSYFLTLNKVDAAKAAFSKIPGSAINNLLSIQEEEEIPESLQKCIREHVCYREYLDAHEAFNDWFKYFHHYRPIPPTDLADNPSFTEKVAHEHKVSQYKAEMERWKLTVSHHVKTTKKKLYNVILFPDGGWLNGIENSEHLRKTCIPEMVLLLYSVLSESGEHSECIQLADILASERHQLYKVYSQEKLEDILKKIIESSIALLDEKKDMWGSRIPTKNSS